MDPNFSIQQYDQVTALSQSTINVAMKYHFQANPAMASFQMDIQDEGYIHATMSAPSVSLQGMNLGTELYFMLNFKSGDFMYWTGRGTDSQQNHLPVDGWTLAFSVSLDPRVIPSTDFPVVDIPGSYSVQQLLVDLGNADVANFNPTLSTTPNLVNNDVAEASLKVMIQMWLQQVQKGTHDLLGYAITVPTPTEISPNAPTFPPTAVKFLVMPYYANDDPNIPVVDSPNNSLLFLGTTNNKPLPTNPLLFTGNLISDSSTDGVMAISRANFFDSFLLLRLISFHRLTLQTLNASWAWIDSQGSLQDTAAPWVLTNSDPTTNPTAFDQTVSWTYFNTAFGNGYSYSFPTMNNQWTTPSEFPFEITTAIQSTITNILRWSNQSNTITINCAATTKRYQTTIGGRSGIVEMAKDHIFINPTYTLTLDSVNDGTLSITPTVDTGFVTCNIGNGDFANAAWFDNNKDAIETNLGNWAVNGISTNIDMPGILADLTTALNQQNSFVFAGNGSFDFKGVMFNREGDFIGPLSFKQQ